MVPRLLTQNRVGTRVFFPPFSTAVLFPIPSLLPDVFHLLVYVTMPGAPEDLRGERRQWLAPGNGWGLWIGSRENRRMGSDGGSEPPAIPFLPHLKHKNLKLSQNYKAAFDTGIGASPFGGTDLLGLPGLRSRWPAGPVLVSQNSVCRHCVIINSFLPLWAVSSPPPATPTKLVEINRGTGKTEPWCPFVWGRLQPRTQALNYPPSRTAFWYYS